MTMDPPQDIRPLLKDWLKEWEAAAKTTGSKMKFVYKNASKSLKDWKEPLYKSSDCVKIKYFGDKMCKRVDETLRAHYLSMGITLPEEQKSSQSSTVESVSSQSQRNSNTNGSTVPASPSKKKRAYCPKPNTGGFAILVALHHAEVVDGIVPVDKGDLIGRAQRFSSESLTAPKTGSHYTAWNSMKTLISNGLVIKEQHRSAFYSLTSDGRTLAAKLRAYLKSKENGIGALEQPMDEELNDSSDEEGDGSQQSQSSSSGPTIYKSITLPAGTFDIWLIIDSREQTSKVGAGLKKTALISELQQRGINVQMRVLQAGDFAWVAREKVLANTGQGFSQGHELVLDVVVERKRADDLESSIKDGRWHEQKYRLKKSGVRQPTYLIEGLDPKKAHHHSLPFRNLQQAVTNAQVIDGFCVKQTKDYEETVNYLATLTNYFTKTLSDKTLRSCPKDEVAKDNGASFSYMTFTEFERNTRKVTNFTIQEMFIKQLLQIKGISVAKGKAIADVYPTIKQLLDAYDECQSEREREFLLSKIPFGENGKAIGPANSKLLYNYYSGKVFNT